MAVQPETKVVDDVIAFIKANGGDAHKVRNAIRNGEPDIDGWMPYAGKIIHMKLEAKTETGQPSRIQRIMVNRYINADYCAGIVRSAKDVMKLVLVYLSEGKNHEI